MSSNNVSETQDTQTSGQSGHLKTYGFEREREYLEVLRAKIHGADDQEEREQQFVEKVRQDVKKRLKALTQ